MEKLKLCVSGHMNILDSSEWVNKEDYYDI